MSGATGLDNIVSAGIKSFSHKSYYQSQMPQ